MKGRTIIAAVVAIALIFLVGVVYFNEQTPQKIEEKEVCIYDAIEIIVNCTYRLEEAEIYNVRNETHRKVSENTYSTDPGIMIPYYTDEIGVLAGGASKYLFGNWYKTTNGISFEYIDRYNYGSMKHNDYIRAWTWKLDESNANLTLTIKRKQIYEKNGFQYENITILGSDSTIRPYGKARVECYPEYIELPDMLKNGRLVAETLWNNNIKGCIVIWYENSKELMITFRREYNALGGTILNPYSGGIPEERKEWLENLVERPGVYAEFLRQPDITARIYINPTKTNLGWSPCEPDEYNEDNLILLFIGFDQKLIEKIDLDKCYSAQGDYYPTLRKLNVFSFDYETIN